MEDIHEEVNTQEVQIIKQRLPGSVMLNLLRQGVELKTNIEERLTIEIEGDVSLIKVGSLAILINDTKSIIDELNAEYKAKINKEIKLTQCANKELRQQVKQLRDQLTMIKSTISIVQGPGETKDEN